MFLSFALPIANVSPFLVYKTKSLLDDFSCSTFSMPVKADISVPHLISLKPVCSGYGLEDRTGTEQPIKKRLNRIAKTLTFVIPLHLIPQMLTYSFHLFC